MKVFQLGGLAAAQTMFHHGSLDGTIIGMAQSFKNSMPIFQGVGQFGSLRAPSAGAPRYIGVKFNENFRLLYKDFDLVNPQYEEGEEIEPKFFLPIIPTVLLNGGSGIAVGFATNILNRNPAELVEACLAVLGGKKCPEVRPWINGFHGDFRRVPDTPKSWTIHGKFEVKNTTTVEVTEIPPSWTYEDYEGHLDALVEKGILVSYEDHSAERPHYVLKFTRQKLAELQEKDRMDGLLKMSEREGENYTTLDENGKLKIFQSQ
jgi:DNA topoisomerase-2